jgi:predicted membrane protein (TIGR00267 family)
MKLMNELKFLIKLNGSNNIMRRYFVVNGFDGALTMLGLIIGFALSATDDIAMIINVCLAAALALAVSGVSSAYISESAERKYSLDILEAAMIHDLQDSEHGRAARWTPLLVALVNGLAPLLISLLILLPLWLSTHSVLLPVSPLYAAIFVAMLLLFLLGVFLGHIAGGSWLQSGFRTLLVAIVTVALIYLCAG